ncbi:hypothetical protein H5410_016187 [Solanum commersonii]|uniref:Exocyst complex component Sec10-like alpha-helical bundle domain-containing protein n=1 Tax=Solanum commersonii TaxID=4109 RepID=A0A9J5ZWB1_SOLCO|nr:hypothetical protein H5410_016187 [Solanum commersonii]
MSRMHWSPKSPMHSDISCILTASPFIRVVAYLSRVLESAFTALEGLNKQAFLTELGNRLHKGLLNHWQKFTFNARACLEGHPGNWIWCNWCNYIVLSCLEGQITKKQVLAPGLWFSDEGSTDYSVDACGGLRLKRDITEYGEFVRSFNAPSVDEKFEQLGIMANVFIVAPESLSTLFEGTPSIRKDAQRFIQLREDYKSAKIAARLSSLLPSSS